MSFPITLVLNARYCAVLRQQYCAAPRDQYPAASREQCCQQGFWSMKQYYYIIVQLSILLLFLNTVKLQCNDNNSEQACSINIVFRFEQPWTTVCASSMLNNVAETIMNNIVQSGFICTTFNSSYISSQCEWVTCLSFLYRTHPRKEEKGNLFIKIYFVWPNLLNIANLFNITSW